MNPSFQSGSRVVTEADVLTFSRVTGDWHPQHVDAEWAAGSAFGERIAHGMLVASVAVGLVDFDHERVVALRRLRDVVFKRPVRLGDSIRVEGAVAESRPVDDETALETWSWRVLNQEDQLVCRLEIEALCRDKAEAPA